MQEIMQAVLEAELVKQLRPPLTDQQRVALAKELKELSWTKPQLDARLKRVKLSDTFGTIALHHWTDEGDILTAAEAAAQRVQFRRELRAMEASIEHRVNAEIERRIQAVRSMREEVQDPRVLELEVERAALQDAALERSKLVEIQIAQRKAERRAFRTWISGLSEKERQAVQDLGVKLGAFDAVDPSIAENLAIFTDDLLPHREEIEAHIIARRSRKEASHA